MELKVRFMRVLSLIAVQAAQVHGRPNFDKPYSRQTFQSSFLLCISSSFCALILI